MDQEKDLKIPTNNPDRDEYISGIGSKEVAVFVIMFFVCIVLAIFIYKFTKNLPASIMTTFLIMAVTILLNIRDKYGENMIDKVRIAIRYFKMQKKYLYKKQDIFGGAEYE